MAKQSSPWRTEYSVQPFQEDKRRLVGLPVRLVSDGVTAIRLGERLARFSTGVVGVAVFERRVAPDLGDYDDPVVLAVHGRVPEEIRELERASLRPAAPVPT